MSTINNITLENITNDKNLSFITVDSLHLLIIIGAIILLSIIGFILKIYDEKKCCFSKRSCYRNNYKNQQIIPILSKPNKLVFSSLSLKPRLISHRLLKG